ncbi:MAG: peroxidase-related enzyme [Candidatus Geothermarchaeales archaeon]
MVWIETIEPSVATGELREVYMDIERRRGKVANLFQAHSLMPGVMRSHLELYLSILFGSSGLVRREREMVAVAVSQANGCSYCVDHHSEALARYVKDKGFIDALRSGLPRIKSERDKAVLQFARKLTNSPGEMAEEDVDRLREAGLGEEEILDLTLVSAYFNLVNRIVNALGVEATPEETRGYRY